MEKLYIVHWGSASSDDDGNARAYTGIHGIYPSLTAAMKGLEECKDTIYDEVVQDEDPECLEYAKQNTNVYGSVKESHFEIDYDLGVGPCEIYITISEV